MKIENGSPHITQDSCDFCILDNHHIGHKNSL